MFLFWLVNFEVHCGRCRFWSCFCIYVNQTSVKNVFSLFNEMSVILYHITGRKINCKIAVITNYHPHYLPRKELFEFFHIIIKQNLFHLPLHQIRYRNNYIFVHTHKTLKSFLIPLLQNTDSCYNPLKDILILVNYFLKSL